MRKRKAAHVQRVVQGQTAIDAPSTELALIGPHPTDRQRNARGQWARANTGHLTTGATSELRALALEPLREQMARDILQDRGFDDDQYQPTRTYRLIVDKLAGASLILEGIETFIGDAGGPITGKGRTRRALTAYLQVLDRVIRLAALVGLDRVPRSVNESTIDWLTREAAPREQQHDDSDPDHDLPDTTDQTAPTPTEHN